MIPAPPTQPSPAALQKLRPQRHPLVQGLRRSVLRALVACGLYPHIHNNRMPFKTLEFRELLKGVRFTGNDRVLDLGCGTGTQTLVVGRRCGSIVGVDVSETAVEQAQQMGTHFDGMIDASFHCTPIEAAGFDAESFDKVCSFCVIEHIPNYQEVLKELHRLLKPNGQMILSADSLETITDQKIIEQHARENFVFQYFREDSFRKALEEAGFRDIKIWPIFRSEFARREFEGGIRKQFSYGFIGAYLKYLRLRLAEALTSKQKPGIFFIAQCRK